MSPWMCQQFCAARFPAVKSLDSFDFPAIPSLNKALVMELARCEYIQRRENVIAVGNSGTGKNHLGLAACQRGMSVGFTTAAALVHELMEARDERRLLNLQRQLQRLNLLIIDELGFVPLSRTGAELLFEVFSQHYERGSIPVTTNLPFDEWTEVFGSERLTGALLDRLTHHVHILELNGESYRLKRSRGNASSQARIHRRTGMDGVRTAEGGEGVTGAMIRARIRVDGKLAGGLQALLGGPMAAYSGCGERDGGIGHGKRRSRTELVRVCGDVGLAGGSVADGCRQAGSGMARSRARARLNCSSQGQRRGRCRVNRRAERVIRPAKAKTRRLRVLVVTIC